MYILDILDHHLAAFVKGDTAAFYKEYLYGLLSSHSKLEAVWIDKDKDSTLFGSLIRRTARVAAFDLALIEDLTQLNDFITLVDQKMYLRDTLSLQQEKKER